MRIVDINSNDDNGLMLQAVHCLPIATNWYDSTEESKDIYYYENSNLDASLKSSSGAIYAALPQAIKTELSSKFWSTDISRESKKQPSDQIKNIERLIIVPSLSDIAQKYSLDKDIDGNDFGIWNTNSLEGKRIKWYANHNWDIVSGFEQSIFNDMFKTNSNDFLKDANGNAIMNMLTRSPGVQITSRESCKTPFYSFFWDSEKGKTYAKWTDSSQVGCVAPIFVL